MSAISHRSVPSSGEKQLFDGPDITPEAELKPITSHNFVTFTPDLHDISLARELGFISLICFAQIMAQAGLPSTVNTYSYIAETFGNVSNGQISWFTASYSLTVGTFILLAGRIGDLYGYKRTFLAGIVWYCGSCLLTGFSGYAKSQIFFDVCRALQGIGPAVMLPNGIAFLGSYYHNDTGKRKTLAMCCFGAVAPGGFFLGSLFSSIIVSRLWWPWMFWIAALSLLAAGILSYMVLPEQHLHAESGKAEADEFDIWGSITGVCGLVLFNFAFNQGPVVGWDTPYVYVLLIVGILFLIAFSFVESRAKYPLVPIRDLSSDTVFVLGCIGSGWSCFGIWLYYTHQFNLRLMGISHIMMAVQFLPALFVGFAAALATVLLLKYAPTSLVMLVAMMCFCGGICIMGTRPVGQTYWAQMFPSVIVTSFGMDISFPAGTVILSNILPRKKQGVAGSIITTVVNYSISIGLGVAGTVERYTMLQHGADEEQQIRYAFYTGMGLSGVGVLLACGFVGKQMWTRKREESGTRSPETDVELVG